MAELSDERRRAPRLLARHPAALWRCCLKGFTVEPGHLVFAGFAETVAMS
jgi:hypothetical protein